MRDERNRGGAAERVMRVAVAVGLLLGVAGCATMPGPDIDAPFFADQSSPTRTAIHDLLAHEATSGEASQVAEFYARRDFRPVWTGSDSAQARAAQVAFVLSHAERQGLRSADYPVGNGRATARPKPGRDAARYDIILTRSLLHYAHDVRLGRVSPNAVYKDVKLPPRSFDPVESLSSALDDDSIDSFLASLPPPHPGYRRLVAALAHYRHIEADGGWHRLSAADAGDPHKLIERLAIEDPALANSAAPSDQDVEHAIERFQARHGLDVDGKVGPATLRALNVPASARLAEIAANMERWRWLPRHFEDRTIRVNVPGQRVTFFVDGKPVLTSKVVIGRASMTTPILRTTAKAVIANPPWNIPDDIAAKSLVPHLRRDPDYLQTRNMTLVGAPPGTKVDWDKVTGNVLPYQIQELPGPHNALGTVLFDMPNDFDVYLHGTPHQNLFTLDNREISHGCVRVEKIGELAQLALAEDGGTSKDTFEAAIAGGTTEHLALDEPLPVYMLYWTAVADADGTVEFLPDRYGRDKPLIARLKGPAHPPRPTRRPSPPGTTEASI